MRKSNIINILVRESKKTLYNGIFLFAVVYGILGIYYGISAIFSAYEDYYENHSKVSDWIVSYHVYPYATGTGILDGIEVPAFKKGEPIQFVSEIERTRSMYVQYNDKLYCYGGIMTRYYPTHQMPKDSFEMIVASKPKQSIWTMNETPDPTDIWCQLYYYTINKTPLGYKKIIEGNTDKFLVNQ